MIKESLHAKRGNPNVLVENKISFSGPQSELSIYDTFEQATKVKLQSDQLLFCGMVSGKKVMHDQKTSYQTEFLPHESFVMAPNHQVAIDFPEAKFEQPTTCLAIEISTEKIERTLNHLEHTTPLQRAYGNWQSRQQLLHTHHTNETQNLLNRIVHIFTENHDDRSFLIDLAITELTARLLRHQTREFIMSHCTDNPDENGLNAALNYIHENLSDPINIDDLCRIACMSRTKFFQQFKSNLGCSPAVYLHQTRLKKSADLIKRGHVITKVCFDLGFNNVSHFSKCFKQLFGFSPSQYRSRALDG